MSLYIHDLESLENRLISVYALMDDYCDDMVLRRSEVARFITESRALLLQLTPVDLRSYEHQGDGVSVRHILRDDLYAYLKWIDRMKENEAIVPSEAVDSLRRFLSTMLAGHALS